MMAHWLRVCLEYRHLPWHLALLAKWRLPSSTARRATAHSGTATLRGLSLPSRTHCTNSPLKKSLDDACARAKSW